jgi:RHS repeat-associated protein
LPQFGQVTLCDATGAIASIGTLAAFDHDLDGRPVSRTLNGVTKTFRFGGAIAYSTAGTPIEADLGEVVIKLDGTGNRYRHLDFRGNVLFQTNNAGNVTGQAVYRGFGRFYVSGNVGERGFAGGFEIPSLGLVVLGPRVLDSDTGRFLSQDPVFNAVNQYAYAQGNPVFFWDPTGRDAVKGTYAVAGWVGGVAGGALAGWIIATAPFSVPALAGIAITVLLAETFSQGAVAATGIAFEFAGLPGPELGNFGSIGYIVSSFTAPADLSAVSAATNLASDFGSALGAAQARDVRDLQIEALDPVSGATIPLGSDPVAVGGGSWTSGVVFSFSGMY